MNGPRSPALDNVLRRVRSLKARAARDRSGCFWIEGVRNFVQACDAGYPVEAVISSPILLKNSLADMLARRLKRAGVPRWRVSPEQFRSISVAERASGIGAIVRQKWMSLDEARERTGLCWIVVEEIASPGNLGTILRTAEAVGASGAIFVGPQCDPFDPALVRASMGGMFALPYVRASVDEVAAWVDARGIELVGLSPEAEFLWTELPATREVGLVIGAERSGLSTGLRSLCRSLVRLPMTGRADSLNVGVAAGVVMYELVRRAGSSIRVPVADQPARITKQQAPNPKQVPSTNSE